MTSLARKSMTLRIAAVTAYVLAMCLVGFAHRPGPAIAALNLPGVSLADFCLGNGAGSGPAGDSKKGCDACRLVVAPGLGAVAGIDLAVSAGFGSAEYRAGVSLVAPARCHEGFGARAPPGRVIRS